MLKCYAYLSQDVGKMADLVLAVCDLLCFASYFFKKQPVKIVKSMIVDFYSPAAVTVAKDKLAEDIAALKIDSWPRPVNRRNTKDTGTKCKHEVDDIFNMLSFVDEQNLLGHIPRYVSDNPEQLPQIRLEKGDVTVILNKMDKMEGILDSLRLELTENRLTLDKLLKAKNSSSIPPLNSESRYVDVQPVDQSRLYSNVLAVADIEAPFSTVYNDRHHSKRARQSDSPPTATPETRGLAASRPTATEDLTVPTIGRRPPVVRAAKTIGQCTTQYTAIKVAPPKPKKAVYCISNLDSTSDADSIKSFLTNEMDIEILSIFPAKTARNDNNASKAFRVCIPALDKNKLLDTTKLPYGVVVREWFFKSSDAPRPLQQPPRNLQSARPSAAGGISSESRGISERGASSSHLSPSARPFTLPRPPATTNNLSWSAEMSPKTVHTPASPTVTLNTKATIAPPASHVTADTNAVNSQPVPNEFTPSRGTVSTLGADNVESMDDTPVNSSDRPASGVGASAGSLVIISTHING
jgi:hypothetical protein